LRGPGQRPRLSPGHASLALRPRSAPPGSAPPAPPTLLFPTKSSVTPAGTRRNFWSSVLEPSLVHCPVADARDTIGTPLSPPRRAAYLLTLPSDLLSNRTRVLLVGASNFPPVCFILRRQVERGRLHGT